MFFQSSSSYTAFSQGVELFERKNEIPTRLLGGMELSKFLLEQIGEDIIDVTVSVQILGEEKIQLIEEKELRRAIDAVFQNYAVLRSTLKANADGTVQLSADLKESKDIFLFQLSYVSLEQWRKVLQEKKRKGFGTGQPLWKIFYSEPLPNGNCLLSFVSSHVILDGVGLMTLAHMVLSHYVCSSISVHALKVDNLPAPVEKLFSAPLSREEYVKKKWPIYDKEYEEKQPCLSKRTNIYKQLCFDSKDLKKFSQEKKITINSILTALVLLSKLEQNEKEKRANLPIVASSCVYIPARAKSKGSFSLDDQIRNMSCAFASVPINFSPEKIKQLIKKNWILFAYLIQNEITQAIENYGQPPTDIRTCQEADQLYGISEQSKKTAYTVALDISNIPPNLMAIRPVYEFSGKKLQIDSVSFSTTAYNGTAELACCINASPSNQAIMVMFSYIEPLNKSAVDFIRIFSQKLTQFFPEAKIDKARTDDDVVWNDIRPRLT